MILSFESIIIILGFLGFILASFIHNKKLSNTRLVCPLRSNCDTVINSDFSRIFGIPVEVLGMFYYAFIAFSYGLVASYAVSLILIKSLFFVSFFAFVFSLYLIFVQAFKIREWCMWCMTSAFISFLIFALAYIKNFF